MKILGEKIAAGEPLMQKALRAARKYKELKGVLPEEEVERLRELFVHSATIRSAVL